MAIVNPPPSQRDTPTLEASVNRVLTPFERFLRNQSSTGMLLLLATLAALFMANTQWHTLYEDLRHTLIGISINDWSIEYSLHYWVNDGLMVLFFFVLGLEIKREVLAGTLREPKQLVLVLLMAVGGMLVPAALYALLTAGTPGLSGWGIPMATDTAFALVILAALGRRIPTAIPVLMSGLAIIDDIGAVMVIGLFYTEQLHSQALLMGAGIVMLMLFFNKAGVQNSLVYLSCGIALWWFVQQSGIHATTAGIVAALTVPARPQRSGHWFIGRMRGLLHRFEQLNQPKQNILEKQQQHDVVEKAQHVAAATTTPLQHWATAWEKPVNLLIVPVFAFLNAGLQLPNNPLELADSSISVGIISGLVIGKCIGISGLAWLAIHFGIAQLPRQVTLRHIIGLSLLAGIGFTMSLFIANLAFAHAPELLRQAKLGVLSASTIACLLGISVFLCSSNRKANNHHPS